MCVGVLKSDTKGGHVFAIISGGQNVAMKDEVVRNGNRRTVVTVIIFLQERGGPHFEIPFSILQNSNSLLPCSKWKKKSSHDIYTHILASAIDSQWRIALFF